MHYSLVRNFFTCKQQAHHQVLMFCSAAVVLLLLLLWLARRMEQLEYQQLHFDHVSKLEALSLSLLLSCMFVGSLYVWPEQHNRDHPSTIKQRMIRISIASMFSCVIVYASSSSGDHHHQLVGNLLEWIGIRTTHHLSAAILPIILLALLFLGPIVSVLIDGSLANLISFDVHNIKFWRNYFVAPLSEELVFRGCMLPLLVPSFGNWSIVLGPLFFGTAHIHHAYEQYKSGYFSLFEIGLSTLFQAAYTTVFGILSSFIFLRTGHLVSAFLSHAFCNMMGFPDFESALHHRYRYRIAFAYCLGLLLFAVCLFPLTEPALFGNQLYVM